MRGDTPFYLIHGWDPRSTLSPTLALVSIQIRDQDPRRWRYDIQRLYQRARAAANERFKIAIQDLVDRHNAYLDPAGIDVGSEVWLYLDRVKEGYARKLAHMWHGTFLVAEMCGKCAVRL